MSDLRVTLQVTRRPQCFSSDEQWAAWLEHLDLAPAFSPCADCLPDFQAEMAACGRCERSEVIFCRDALGLVTGISRDDPRFADLFFRGRARGLTPLSPIPAPTADAIRELRSLIQDAPRRVQDAVRTAIRQYKETSECPDTKLSTTTSPSSNDCPAMPAPATCATGAAAQQSTPSAPAAWARAATTQATPCLICA